MVYGYVRVSTTKQTLENQRFEILEYCKSHNILTTKISFMEDVKSGTITYKDRVLGKLLKKLKKEDVLIISEISRLGRSMLMVMEILNQLLTKGVTLISVKENMIFDNTISSKVITFAFSLSAEIERNLISQRTKEALALRKEQGIKLGRPFNSKNKSYKLDKYKTKIQKMLLDKNNSIYRISKVCKCNLNTLKNYIKRNNLIWAKLYRRKIFLAP